MSLFSAILDAVDREGAPTVLGLSGSESTLANPQPWLVDAFGGLPTATGKVVNISTAARFTAVSACVNVLGNSVGQIPCELMRSVKGGGAEPATDHPLYGILRNLFNAETTAQTGFELAMNHLCYRGTSYTQVVRGQGGQVVGLQPLAPDFMRMSWTDAGALHYTYTPPGVHEEFSPSEIWRVIGRTRDGITGLSPIMENRESIGLGLAAEEFGSKLFANGAEIGTVFEHPGKMSKEAQERFRKSIQAKYSGSKNAHGILVVEENMKVAKVAMTSQEAQYIELRKFQIAEICRIFNVPPHMIQELDRATFNNIEHLSLNFVNTSLMPWLVRFAQTGFRDLLTPNERKRLFLRFDTDSLLQADRQATANFYASLITNKIINPNTAAIKLGFQPHPGGEVYANPNTTSDSPGDKPGEPIPAPTRG